MIPDEVIAEIRSRVDIVAVIGQHVQLRKAGRNWKGLCPFHGEKTPSFNVAADKGFFYCFGCQKKGDVFTFVMELEGKSFAEAAEQLAARAGIHVPRLDESPEQRRARGERVAMLDICKVAAEVFRANLRDPQRGAAARVYLESRGVGDAISERFLLGYGTADWHAMADALRDRRVDLELALKLGLIARQPRAGGFYDRFRDRLVCPVVVPGGDVVGFSARVLPAAPSATPDPRGEAPKYINSPESLVYKKSKLLFGLAQAREAMAAKGRAVLVEGNFDVITFHQAGIAETVAPLGTALTPEQVETLRRSAAEVVLCYDGDRAGRAATRAALELLVSVDLPVRVVALPDGEDPDSLVRRGGADKAIELIERAVGGIEYFCFEVWGKARASADARAGALDDAARLIAKVASPTKRDLIIGTLASAMELDVQVVRKAVARQGQRGDAGRGAPRGRGSAHPNAPDHPNAPSSSPSHDLRSDRRDAPSLPPSEEAEVLALLADHPALVATPDADKAFSLLTDARLRDMYSAARQGQSMLEFAHAHLPQPTADLVLSAKYADAVDPKARLVALTEHLVRRASDVGLRSLGQRLAEAKRSGDRELERSLVAEILSTRKQVD
ncbi:MAG: DNA primase [Kofleriaceae bacterium]